MKQKTQTRNGSGKLPTVKLVEESGQERVGYVITDGDLEAARKEIAENARKEIEQGGYKGLRRRLVEKTGLGVVHEEVSEDRAVLKLGTVASVLFTLVCYRHSQTGEWNVGSMQTPTIGELTR